MNIFWLDTDVHRSAAYACDQHIVKMITEHSQQMCTVLASLGFYRAPLAPTHQNHPCVRWVAEDFANFACLVALNDAYFNEFRLRYQHDQHAGYWRTHDFIQKLTLAAVRQKYAERDLDRNRRISIEAMLKRTERYMTVPPRAMPDEFRVPMHRRSKTRRECIAAVVESYRNYYAQSKSAFARYKTGQIPPFMSLP